MRIAKWGNSLSCRIPHWVVKALDLHVGEELFLRLNSDTREIVMRTERPGQQGDPRYFSPLPERQPPLIIKKTRAPDDFSAPEGW